MADMTRAERDALLRRMLELFKDDIEQSPNPAKTAFILQVLLGFLDGDLRKETLDGAIQQASSDEEIIARCEYARELKGAGRGLREILQEGLLSFVRR